MLIWADNLQTCIVITSRSDVASCTLHCRRSIREDVITGCPSLGWTTTKPGPWKVGWKDSPEPRPMRDPILKLLLICGWRFANQQIAACGSTKVGCWEQSRSNGGLSEGGVFVSFSGGVWLSSVAVGGDFATEFRIRYCHGQASSPRSSCERRADPGLGRRG